MMNHIFFVCRCVTRFPRQISGILRSSSSPVALKLGDTGDDIIIGSAGDDSIDGGTVDDVVLGNAGNDTFLYSGPLDGHDIVADFDGDAAGGQDVLNLGPVRQSRRCRGE
jgi:hypothetical protein